MRKGGLYVAMGDSVTWTSEVTATLYASRVHRSIVDTYAPVQHANKGVGGSDTKEWIDMIARNVLSLPFDLVTIGLGMNDSASDVTGVTNYGNNLRTIVDRLKKRNPNVDIILCAPNHTSDSTRTPYIQNYRNQMQTVATEKNVKFCDFSQAFTTAEVSTYTLDGIHPNDAGHKKIYDLLWPIVQTTKFVSKLS